MRLGVVGNPRYVRLAALLHQLAREASARDLTLFTEPDLNDIWERPLPQIGIYAMSKATVIQMTQALALEWGRFGINVNAICPGYIETEINQDFFQWLEANIQSLPVPESRIREILAERSW